MRAVEAAARAALSWVFIFSGQDVLRHPEKPSKTAAPLLAAIRSRAPVPMPDDVVLVRVNAAVQVTAGLVFLAIFGVGWLHHRRSTKLL